MKKRTVVLILAIVLVLGISIGGTVAWLTAVTDPVPNTFTVGNIEIDLDESDDLDLTMVPGNTITKDPAVTVYGGSEECWLFVEIEKSANFDDFMTYEVIGGENGWTALEGHPGVYYRKVTASENNQVFGILTNDQVAVKSTVTKGDMDALTEETLPTLTFTAYAVQSAHFATAADAWDEAK